MIKILILEHDLNDLGLLQYELKKSGLNYISEIVQTKQDYEKALQSFKPDLILSDYSLPAFDGFSAFQIKQLDSPEIPFIIVSGTIGEERAVELIKLGVTDYALKEKMFQIIPKIDRALKEAAERRHKEVAEQQLLQREEQLQKIMDLSLDVICTLDQDGKFVTVGAASKSVLGYLPEELIGCRVIDLEYEEDKERTHKALIDLRNGINMVNFERRFKRKDGSIVTVFWSARWDVNEKLEYSVARDATEIKAAEEKLRNSEKRFRTLIQNSTDGWTLLAADGTVIERSPTGLKILGLDAREDSGKLRLDLVHPDDRTILEEACIRVMASPSATPMVEYRFLQSDGNYRWIEASVHNQLNEPAVGAIVLNFRDITERKQAEIALEKSEEKYRNLFNLSPAPMWLFCPDSLQFLDVNEATVKHYGYTREEFLAMTLRDIRPKEELGKLKTVARALKVNKLYYQDISRHMKKTGEVIDVDVKNGVVELEGREARLVLATDVSERMKYIKAIEEQNRRLREIAWIQSHVVRAPLARMMGLVGLLNYQIPTKVNTEEILNHISSSAHELDAIIRDIVKKSGQVEEK